jgi:hypothetical protein
MAVRAPGLVRATIGGTALTYADWAKRMDDDGKVATIINLLSQTNEILDDCLVVEANLPTTHKTTVRTGLPQATWRLLNYGVAKTKSTTAQVQDGLRHARGLQRDRQVARRSERQHAPTSASPKISPSSRA